MKQKIKKIPCYKNLLPIFLLIFIFLNLFFFFILPFFTKTYLIKKLSNNLKRNVSIEEIKINPYTLSFHIKNFFISEKESNDIFFSSLKIDCDISFFYLIKGKFVISNLYILSPFIKIIRYNRNSYNFSDLLKGTNDGKKVFYFSLYNLKIEDGAIIFDDKPEKSTHLIKKINFTLPFVSNFPSFTLKYKNPSFSAIVNRTPLKIEGETKFSTYFQEIDFDINVNNLYLPKYLNYIPFSFNFDFTSGYLNGIFKISFVQSFRKKTSLTIRGNIELLNFVMVDNLNSSFLKIPRIKIKGSLDLPNKIIEVSELSLTSPEIHIVKEKKGDLNIVKIFSGFKKEERNQTQNSLKFEINNIKISNGKFFFQDLSLRGPFNTTLENITFHGNKISNKKDKIGKFYFFGKEKEGIIEISGIGTLNPILSKGVFRIENLILRKYFPYYKSFLNLETGNLTLKGNYIFDLKNKDIKLVKTDIKLQKLYFTEEDEHNFAKIPYLFIKDIDFDLINKRIGVDILKTENGLLALTLKDFKFNFPFEIPEKNEHLNSKNIKNWEVFLKQIDIKDYNFQLKDNTLKEPILIEKFNFNCSDINTNKATKIPVNLFFQINEGYVSAKGYMVLNPLIKGNLQIEFEEIYLPFFQYPISKKFDLTIVDGIFSTKGYFTFEKTKDNLTFINYTGNALLKKLKTIDRLFSEDLFSADKIYLENINISHNPDLIAINEIFIRGFSGNIIIYQDGKINIINVFKMKNEESFIRERNLNIFIEKIDFKDGKINLIDKNAQPDHTIETFNFNGIITNFSINGKEQENIEFYANFENVSLSKIIEKIKYFIQKSF